MSLLASLLGVELPVIQAPMAGVQNEALAMAVSRAGGLGSMPCALLGLAQLREALEQFASLPQPVNLNFFCHPMPATDPVRDRRWRSALAPYYQEFGIEMPEPSIAGARRPIDAETVELLAHRPPRVISFHFGLPEPSLLRRIKAWGTTVLASATTVDEGRWLERHGVDAVIAQGIEAGGHRGHFLSDDLRLQPSTRDLVAQLRGAIHIPIIAAGAISSRADAVAMLDAGASGVQAGTAFLLCPETQMPAVHRIALQRDGTNTALTNLLTGRPARGIPNRLMLELGPMSDLPPEFPWAAQTLAPLRTRAEALGRDDFTPMWCGTKSNNCRPVSAASVTRELAGAG